MAGPELITPAFLNWPVEAENISEKQLNMKKEDTPVNEIIGKVEKLKNFFQNYQSHNIDFRINKLKKFKAAILNYEERIIKALGEDLHKSPEESYLTEIYIVLQEIENHIRNLEKWAKPKKVKTPYQFFPSSSRIIYEPLGIALIIAPWNYPFHLLMNPLIGAISSGCCTMLKPSPYTPATAEVMEELIKETFDDGYVSIVQGGREVNKSLFGQRFDIIFFTGSSAVGKVVMKAAAEFLTPVVLELGGKSPCIVDKEADIEITAKRIAWGKTINAGQTCIAPDYLFVHESAKEELLPRIAGHFEVMYGKDIKSSPYFPRIVTENAVKRIQKLMEHGKIVFGGDVDIKQKYIEPTIIDEVRPDFPVMQEEIFGPVLPVMTFSAMDDVIRYLNENEKPLALYYFGKKSGARHILKKTSSGGVCINDTILHNANHHLPFGGTGNSGMGRYHGKQSFLAFSNTRSILKTPSYFDNPYKYPPFKNFRQLKKFI